MPVMMPRHRLLGPQPLLKDAHEDVEHEIPYEIPAAECEDVGDLGHDGALLHGIGFVGFVQEAEHQVHKQWPQHPEMHVVGGMFKQPDARVEEQVDEVVLA